MKLNLICLTLIFCISMMMHSIVQGDWQYTKWGMTAEDIVAASNGSARLVRESEKVGQSGETFDTIALGTYSTGPFKFDVSFRALKGGHTLDTVRLELKDPRAYGRLREALIGKYGTSPETVDDIGSLKTTKTMWKAENESISLTRMEDFVLGDKLIFLDYSDSLLKLGL